MRIGKRIGNSGPLNYICVTLVFILSHRRVFLFTIDGLVSSCSFDSVLLHEEGERVKRNATRKRGTTQPWTPFATNVKESVDGYMQLLNRKTMTLALMKDQTKKKRMIHPCRKKVF
jgi:hypothetical protein